MDFVLYRTTHPLTNDEESLSARLTSLRRDARSVLDELENPEPTAAVVEEIVQELRRSASSFISGLRRLDPSSPYREAALAEALFWLNAVSESGIASLADRLRDVIDIDEHLLRLSDLAAAVSLGTTLKAARERQGFGLRKLADRAEISPGYVSEIERGKRDVPSKEVGRKLDAVLGSHLESICISSRDRSSEIKQRISDRLRRQRSAAIRGFDLADPENARLIDRLSDDPDIRQILDVLIGLPKPAVRGVRRLVEELNGL